MYKTMKVRMWIEVVIRVDQPVMRSGESQVADFVLPALEDLKESSLDVKDVQYVFDEREA